MLLDYLLFALAALSAAPVSSILQHSSQKSQVASKSLLVPPITTNVLLPHRHHRQVVATKSTKKRGEKFCVIRNSVMVDGVALFQEVSATSNTTNTTNVQNHGRFMEARQLQPIQTKENTNKRTNLTSPIKVEFEVEYLPPDQDPLKHWTAPYPYCSSKDDNQDIIVARVPSPSNPVPPIMPTPSTYPNFVDCEAVSRGRPVDREFDYEYAEFLAELTLPVAGTIVADVLQRLEEHLQYHVATAIVGCRHDFDSGDNEKYRVPSPALIVVSAIEGEKGEEHANVVLRSVIFHVKDVEKAGSSVRIVSNNDKKDKTEVSSFEADVVVEMFFTIDTKKGPISTSRLLVVLQQYLYDTLVEHCPGFTGIEGIDESFDAWCADIVVSRLGRRHSDNNCGDDKKKGDSCEGNNDKNKTVIPEASEAPIPLTSDPSSSVPTMSEPVEDWSSAVPTLDVNIDRTSNTLYPTLGINGEKTVDVKPILTSWPTKGDGVGKFDNTGSYDDDNSTKFPSEGGLDGSKASSMESTKQNYSETRNLSSNGFIVSVSLALCFGVAMLVMLAVIQRRYRQRPPVTIRHIKLDDDSQSPYYDETYFSDMEIATSSTDSKTSPMREDSVKVHVVGEVEDFDQNDSVTPPTKSVRINNTFRQELPADPSADQPLTKDSAVSFTPYVHGSAAVDVHKCSSATCELCNQKSSPQASSKPIKLHTNTSGKTTNTKKNNPQATTTKEVHENLVATGPNCKPVLDPAMIRHSTHIRMSKEYDTRDYDTFDTVSL